MATSRPPPDLRRTGCLPGLMPFLPTVTAKAKAKPAKASPPRKSVWTVFRWLLTLGGLMSLPAWLALGLLSGAWYAFERHIARPPMLWMGEPQPNDPMNPMTWTRTLRNPGFMLGYSDIKANPLWVVYALNPPGSDATATTAKPRPFAWDWRRLDGLTAQAFDGSGWVAGPLAAPHAIAVAYGGEGESAARRLSNASPQRPGLADKLWVRLEDLILWHFTQQFGEVWVVAGPIFDPPQERLPKQRRLEIPDAFYKIIAAPQAHKMLAFIVPQTVRGDEPLDHYLASVDAIEKRTGLDFFSQLDNTEENRLESSIDPDAWHLHGPVKPSQPIDTKPAPHADQPRKSVARTQARGNKP